MFGPRIVRAFEAVKDAFDPGALLNPNRVVRPPRMDDRRLFRYGPDYGAAPDFTPALDWSGHPGPLGGMLGAIEMYAPITVVLAVPVFAFEVGLALYLIGHGFLETPDLAAATKNANDHARLAAQAV